MLLTKNLCGKSMKRESSIAFTAIATMLVTISALGMTEATCDFSQEVVVGLYYNIANPNYPQKYKGGTQCRWRATTAPGARLKLSCGTFDIPASNNCEEDRVLISTSGDNSLRDAHVYCGSGSFTQISDDNKLTMVLKAPYFSQGGRFLCNITAEYAPCICGMKKETRIVGGENTGVNEYPFMAGLISAAINEVICGATIISDHYAVTAAHCVEGRNISATGLVVGEHDVSTGKETNATKLFKLLKFILHPDYDADTNDNDIALVLVNGTIPRTREVMPVCLPFRYKWDSFANERVEVLGWGTTEFGGATSPILQKADLNILPQANCSRAFDHKISYRQICSFNKGKDACQMDSGGPLYWQDPKSEREYLVGIVSNGIGCATNIPGVNTRVTSYLEWIVSIVTKEDRLCFI